MYHERKVKEMATDWRNLEGLEPKTYICGFCGLNIGSVSGFKTSSNPRRVYICPYCDKPTYFGDDEQVPGAPFGNEVQNLPMETQKLYREIRNCSSVSAYTAAVLLCRKLLMNIAVEQSAPPNKTFQFYVSYLSDKGFIPPNAKGWVDHIRSKGNEATHEIVLMTQPEAEELIVFAEMLLKIIYEFPQRVPPSVPATTT